MKKIIFSISFIILLFSLMGFVTAETNNATSNSSDLDYCMIITSGHELNLGVLTGKNMVSLEECSNMVTITDGNKIKNYVCSNEKGTQNVKIIWRISTLATSTYECSPTCTDSDGGNNVYQKGETTETGSVNKIIPDHCVLWNQKSTNIVDYVPVSDCSGNVCFLFERLCEGGMDSANGIKAGTGTWSCENGCKDGACIKISNEQCKQDSDCPQIMCIKAPCPGYKCVEGKCIIDNKEIKEQVKCIFDGSNQEQKCYTAEQNSRAGCSGKESCVADILGYKGEKITWKSTCGGYAYTFIDGNDEYAKFDCKNIGTCQPTKCDDGTVYECKIYNGQCICPTCPPIIIKPVCGNGVCESGEGEICVAPMIACAKGEECKIPKPSCYVSCPQDCKITEPIFTNLNEKFKLQVYQPAKIRENNNDVLKITFKDLIAYKCKETEMGVSESQAIRANVAIVTGNAILEATTTITSSGSGGGSTTTSSGSSSGGSGGGSSSSVSSSGGGGGEGSVSVLKCIGAGPKALLEVETIVNGELGKNNIINLDVGEKKQVGDFTIYFPGYDYASRTGTFLVVKETFSCPVGCKCDNNGEIVICSNKTCGGKETLCPDGTCKNKCEINSEDCKYGCLYEGKCFPMGVRSNGTYCSDNLVMGSQKKSDDKCDNNFECSSNVCVSGKCISEGFLNKIMNWFKRMFGGK
jgi:hypothetical protein